METINKLLIGLVTISIVTTGFVEYTKTRETEQTKRQLEIEQTKRQLETETRDKFTVCLDTVMMRSIEAKNLSLSLKQRMFT